MQYENIYVHVEPRLTVVFGTKNHCNIPLTLIRTQVGRMRFESHHWRLDMFFQGEKMGRKTML